MEKSFSDTALVVKMDITLCHVRNTQLHRKVKRHETQNLEVGLAVWHTMRHDKWHPMRQTYGRPRVQGGREILAQQKSGANLGDGRLASRHELLPNVALKVVEGTVTVRQALQLVIERWHVLGVHGVQVFPHSGHGAVEPSR